MAKRKNNEEAWTPDDATVEKAARAAMNAAEGSSGYAADIDELYRQEARAALLAVVPGIVAEAVKTEAELDEVLRDVTASLVAAVSLLRSGGKKAAPSNKMFATMLDDYEKSIVAARAIIRARHS